MSKADIEKSEDLMSQPEGYSPHHYPIACAIKRRFPLMPVVVGGWEVTLGHLGVFYLPPIAREFSFNYWKQTTPIRFRITKKINP